MGGVRVGQLIRCLPTQAGQLDAGRPAWVGHPVRRTEFVVLLPGADEREACLVAERLRERVSAIALPASGAQVTVTVSIGVAALGHAR